jgi:hypothetical protein
MYGDDGYTTPEDALMTVMDRVSDAGFWVTR